MARLRGSSLANSTVARELRDRIAAQRQSLAQAQARYLELGGSLDALGAKAGSASGGLGKLLEAAQATPGPLGGLVSRVGALRALVAGGPLLAGVLGLAAGFLTIVVASTALVGAVGAATAALLRYGLAQAEARRSETLRLEGLVRLRSAYGLAAGSATELQAAIDRVSDSSALGRSEVGGYAEQLYRMGLRGGALEEALDGMAIAGSAGGERLARRFAGLAVGAARMGRSVRAVADDFRARFGGVAAAQALGFDRQMLRLRQNVSRIFDGLKIEGLLRALRMATSLFSQSTASGRALRQIAEVVFQPLIDAAANGGPVVRRVFQGMILRAQELTILFLRARNAFVRAFGGRDVLGGLDMQSLALRAGALLVTSFVAAVVTATIALAGFATVLGVVAAGVLVMTAPILAAVAALGALAYAGVTYGEQLMTGLVSGIQKGRSLVVATLRGVASDATAALRSALQISSPSRVFAQLGVQIPRGLAEGVEAGTSAASGAVESMVSAEAPRAAARGGSSISISIGDVHITAGHTDQPRELAQNFVDEVVRLLEGANIELGGAR
ncbi:hypothetical protein [Sandaracinus amylolyticus]|nr:hypothetical protein [Sandaracinus amylolyticus]